VPKRAKALRSEVVKFRTGAALKEQIARAAASQDRSVSSYLESLCRNAGAGKHQQNSRRA
jgi:hypothetical protein